MKYSGRKKNYIKMSFKKGADFSVDASCLDLSKAADESGFDCSDGSLENGWGVATTYVDGTASGMWMFRKGDGIPMWSAGSKVLYKTSLISVAQTLDNVSVSGNAYGVNFKYNGDDAILIYSDEGSLYLWDGVNKAVQLQAAGISSLAVYDDKIFAAKKDSNELLYCSASDPTQFGGDECKSIDISDDRGNITKIIPFLEYLFVFKDYGITRITALSGGEFKLENLFLEGGKIYPGTVCLCGNAIIFMADSGFYSFNGRTAKPILKELFPLIRPSQLTSAAYMSGKYFLSASSDGGRILAVSNLESFNITRNIGITLLFPMEGNLLCLTNSMVAEVVRTGKYYHNIIPKRWVSPAYDFGTSALKHIRSVSIRTEGEITFTVTADGVSRAFRFDKDGEANVNLRGKYITFRIDSTAETVKITAPIICYSVI